LGCVPHRVWPGSEIQIFFSLKSKVKGQVPFKVEVRDRKSSRFAVLRTNEKDPPGLHGFWSFMALSNRPLTRNNISKI
jgi:hypothetical protein